MSRLDAESSDLANHRYIGRYMTKQIMNRVLFAAEQHLDYMNRSIASESGRYTEGERDLLINDVFAMGSIITEIGETNE